jgi:ribosomal protein S12 methylthiotransferase accessory factor
VVAIPEQPRLRSGCAIFEDGEGLVVRSLAGVLAIDRAHSGAIERILNRLDGKRGLPAIFEGESSEVAFYALRALSALSSCGLLHQGPAPTVAAAKGEMALRRLDGVRLLGLGSGRLAQALYAELERAGATCVDDQSGASANEVDVALGVLDGADLGHLHEWHADMAKRHLPWLPVFPFGEAIVLGPRLAAAGPCVRCFELRWLGRSRSVAGERAFLNRLRAGSIALSTVESEAAALALARRLAPVMAELLTAESPAGLLFFAHSELSLLERSFVDAHPLCDVCALPASPAPVALTREHWLEPALPLPELARVVEPLAEGPCSLVEIMPPLPGASPLAAELRAVVLSRFAFPDPDQVEGEQQNFCHGAASNLADARTLAIVEAAERYNGLLPPLGASYAAFRNLADQALDPNALPLFSERQYARPGFRFRPFHPDEPLWWSRGVNLTQNQAVLVPSSAVYYGYDDHLLGECSSGVAAHTSRGHALLNAVLELVERDAFMIHWLHRLSPPRLDRKGLDQRRLERMLNAVQAMGYDVHVLDLTTDLEIPVVLALATRTDQKRPALLVGAGSALASHVAVERAVSELFSAMLGQSPVWSLGPALAVSEVRRLADHSRAYEHPVWLPHAEFLWSSQRVSSRRSLLEEGDLRTRLETVIARLQSCGHDLIGVEMTAPDVRKHRLRVVRAIVPGLQPLGLEGGGRFGGTRLYQAPLRMGYGSQARIEADLNPIPHCFP